nr:Chain C, ILE-LEU-GLY-LYS-PHE-LEU-HIS-TRP-LEU [Homo sapiens]5MEP_F Chain F, ILE-LEU-GLY-LYS-PHE-LEU-HIS-TRP-LEU [Homo sapiens]
ILGKFLHWL